MSNRIEQVIVDIEEYIDGCKMQAFSNTKIIVDRPQLEEFLDDVRSAAPGMRLLFTGDGVPVHRARIREMLGEEAVFAPPALCWLRPSVAGLLALEKGQETDWSGLREIYLRPPHAEKNRKLLEAMRNE